MSLFGALLATGILLLLPSAGVEPHGVNVKVRVELTAPDLLGESKLSATIPVVLWLSPMGRSAGLPQQAVTPGHYRIEQKQKKFNPHLLVVPVGSTVEFPNLDPFFHNVFSQFNGKRFDLGLYEAGSTKSVRFDHEGASYLFCNIHSQMGAVIVTLATPYFVVANGDGMVELHNVPSGDYTLHVWAEGVDPSQLAKLARVVRVPSSDSDAGLVRVPASVLAQTHKNKFGEDYPPEHDSSYP